MNSEPLHVFKWMGLPFHLAAFAWLLHVGGLSAQQWSPSSVPYGRTVNAAAILESGRIVVVGGNPQNDALQSVFSSITSGVSWNIDSDNMAPWLWDVDFADSANGIAVGSEGSILRLTAEGTSQEVVASGTGHSLRGVRFLSSETAVAVGGTDGVEPVRTILRTTDAGQNWTTVVEESGAVLSSIGFRDGTTGFAVGRAGTILRTDNGGLTWVPVASPTARDLNAITFIDGQKGFIVGGRFNNDSIRTVLVTENGGASWTVVLDEPGGWLRDVIFLNAETGYAVGSVGSVLVTVNGGMSWTPVVIPGVPVSVSFNTVRAGDGIVLIAGSQGQVRVLNDIPPPVTTTVPAIILSPTTARLRGTVDTYGQGGISSFIIGTTPDLISAGETFTTVVTGEGEQPVAFIVPNLPAGATFYFSAKGRTIGGVSYGDTLPFTLIPTPPIAVTSDASMQSPNSATLRGIVNTYGLEAQVSFLYSTDPLLAGASETVQNFHNTEDDLEVSMWAGNLMPQSVYFFCIKVTTGNGNYFGDTLSFHTFIPELHMDSISGAYSGDVTFHGRVSGLLGDGEVTFTYWQPSQPETVVQAQPGQISGQGPHFVSAQPGVTLPTGAYNVRLDVSVGQQTYSSYMMFFLVGNVYSELAVTDVSYDMVSEVATFTGVVSGLIVPATMFFSYGNAMVAGTVDASPHSIDDNATHTVTASVSLPADNTEYWISLIADTDAGWIYSTHLPLTTGITDTFLKTLTAHDVDGPSALLRGHVGDIDFGASVYFDFGITPQLGTVISATPSVVQAGTPTEVTAHVDGLALDSYYYYCLVAEVGTVTFRADTRQVFTGLPPIPNWDFSEWEPRTVELPVGWNILDTSFERVNLGAGNSALRLSGYNVAMLGRYRNNDNSSGGQMPDFHGTVSIGHRPENIHVNLEYDVEPDESCYMILQLDSAGITLHFDLYPITGSSGGAFEEWVIPIDYTGSGTPDTMMIGFITFDVMASEEEIGAGNNHLTIDRVHFGPGAPAVDHTGIDEWFDYTYSELPGWTFLKFLAISSTESPMVVAPFPYADGMDTAAAVYNKLLGEGFNDYGRVMTGSSSMGTGDHLNFFDVDTMHQVLTGYYMFSPQGGDTLQVTVEYQHEDDYVGRLVFTTADPANEMTPFETVSNTYFSGGPLPIPDKAYISIELMNRSGGHPETFAVIDKLSFDGLRKLSVETGDTIGIAPRPAHGLSFTVHPNPATDNVRTAWGITGGEGLPSGGLLRITDMRGRPFREIPLSEGSTGMDIPMHDATPGLYLVTLNIGNATVSKRLIVIR